jgi:hypothetical protein
MIRTIAIFIFIVGVYIFGMSYHNIDLAVNAVNGSIDTNGFGYSQDLKQMYLNGMMGMNISAVSMISGFALLFGLRDKDYNSMKEEKEYKEDLKEFLE